MSPRAAHGAPAPRRASAWLVPLLVALHLALALGAARATSSTFDETAHVAGGLAMWRTGDYRINPEAGNLPQRVAGALAAASGARLPPLDGPVWWSSSEWDFGQALFYEVGNDPERLLFAARAGIALLGAALGLAIFAVARGAFGSGAGLAALACWAVGPTLLAHGALATSDLCAALFFFLALAAARRALERLTWTRVAASSLALAGACLSKFSFPLLVVVLAGMSLARVAGRAPLETALLGARTVSGASRKLAALAPALLVHAAVACAAVWASYGLRFAALADAVPGRDRLYVPWDELLAKVGSAAGPLATARDARLLPEAFLYGLAFVLQHAGGRPSFLNGESSLEGFASFFPYAFLAKTELAVLVLGALGVFAWLQGEPARRRALAPFLAFALVYGAVAVAGRMNIGHRHLLPVYPLVYVLAGGGAAWLAARAGALRFAAPLLIALAWVETLPRWPHALSFFNVAAGGPSNGWRHLVDSSLDWGQDLPAVKRWVDERRARGETRPLHLAWFGTSSPTWYGVDALRLPGWIDRDLHGARPLVPLRAGTYVISATLLQGVCTAAPGPWNPRYEAAYRDARAKTERFLAARRDPERLRALLAEQPEPAWIAAAAGYEGLRAARLFAYLREREPSDRIAYSVLVYDLEDADLAAALDGPLGR